MTNLRFRHSVRRDRENQKYKAAHSAKRVLYRTASFIMIITRCLSRPSLPYRVAQKNGANVFHCKYFENSTTNLRGSW